jgi:hypothetical protein
VILLGLGPRTGGRSDADPACPRVRFDGDTRTVTDGPFAETRELLAGYWLWRVKSMDEAVEWLKRAPFDGGAEVEIRQVFDDADFGDEFTPELREREARLRAVSTDRGQRRDPD